MSTIYGFYAGSHSASSVLVEDGKIRFAVEEERISRVKAGLQYESYPVLSHTVISEKTGISASTADYVVVADPIHQDFMEKLSGGKYETIPHHLAHNMSSYFISGMEGKVLSISLDGGGESSYGRVYLCEDGEYNLVKRFPMSIQGSISAVWAFTTNSIRGYNPQGEPIWRMLKDEGKLMGCAPDGEFRENYYNILKSIINYDEGMFYPTNSGPKTRFVIDLLKRKQEFENDKNILDFAHCLQLVTEEVVLKFMDELHRDFPNVKKLCFSGGLFANVKLNQKINELPWVEEIFITPPMGDEGLALGCALWKSNQIGELSKPLKIDNVRFGIEYSDEQIYEMSRDHKVFRYKYEPSMIAQDINDGKVIGWFQGGMEFGPRALGSRSILVRPTDYTTHSYLNEKLNRHDTMPFAPMVLEEEFDNIFTCGKSKYAAQFMTVCYSTKDEWIEKIPAVIQKSDKTARPQVVNQTNNPMVWELMKEYQSLSDIPVLLNTSFNIHNEPIIENPNHAFTHLVNNVVDKLVIGNYVYESRRPKNKV
jgi:carbamoyltransferase